MPILGRIAKRRLVEAAVPVDDTASDTSRWRRLTEKAPRNLSDYDHKRMLDIALYLYRFNPLAHRGVEIMRDFVVGSGIRIEAKDKSIQSVIDRFWNNPVHKMDRLLARIAFELSLYGEFISPALVNRHNGDVELSYISPLQVKDVTLNRGNLLLFDSVEIMPTDISTESSKLKVINLETDVEAHLDPEDPNSPSTYGYRTGDCFYFSVNRVGDASRGLSDLLAVADFVDSLDQLIFNSLERMTHETGWLWDIEMQGASNEQCQQKVAELEAAPPRPGSFLVHNEWVKWNPMKIGLEAENVTDESLLIRNYALGGMGVPVHFFSEPQGAGRAVAESMAAPAYQSLESRQSEVEGFVREILDFVIDQKLVRKMLDSNLDRSYDVIMPKISLRNLQRTGGAMNRTAQALKTAQDEGWIDSEQGKKVFVAMLEQLGLGVDLTPSQELPGVASSQRLPSDVGFSQADVGVASSQELPKELR